MPGRTNSRHPRRGPGFFAAIVLLACTCAANASAQSDARFRIGASSTAILVWIAQDFGLFAEQGTSVEVTQVRSGVEALDLVQAGSIELGTSSEFAFISRAINDGNLCIFGTLSASRTITLLGRSDRVRGGPEGLVGKRIGVTLGSAARFMLWQFLTLSGIDENSVHLVDMQPPELVASMREGSVDAAIVWEPYVTSIRNAVPVELVEYDDQADQHYYFTLQGRCDLPERRGPQLTAVLTALVRAERLISAKEAEAKAAYGKRFGFNAAEVHQIWALHSLSLRLPQDLVPLMETEGRWRVDEGLTDRAVPNVLDLIRHQPLEAVDPSAVQIIR